MGNGRAGYQVLREGRRRWLPRGRGRIHLNAIGWLALITLGSVVSIAAAIAFPLVYAAALGAAAALFAYGVEYYFTVREIRRGAGGRPGGPPDGEVSGDREPRRPRSPLPTLSASRAVDERS
jgi:energy-converting hydrogenase Eha subunit C